MIAQMECSGRRVLQRRGQERASRLRKCGPGFVGACGSKMQGEVQQVCQKCVLASVRVVGGMDKRNRYDGEHQEVSCTEEAVRMCMESE